MRICYSFTPEDRKVHTIVAGEGGSGEVANRIRFLGFCSELSMKWRSCCWGCPSTSALLILPATAPAVSAIPFTNPIRRRCESARSHLL